MARLERHSAISTSYLRPHHAPQRKINSNKSRDSTLKVKVQLSSQQIRVSFFPVHLSALMASSSNPCRFYHAGLRRNRRALTCKLPWQPGRLAMCNGSPFTLPLITADYSTHTLLYLTRANTQTVKHTLVSFMSDKWSYSGNNRSHTEFSCKGKYRDRTPVFILFYYL